MNFLTDALLWLIKGRSYSELKSLQDIYRTSIEDLKAELKEQKQIIAVHKKKHPENGKELDEWEAREEKLHNQIITLLNENRDLREELIFLKKSKK
jgi:hypothetical protein